MLLIGSSFFTQTVFNYLYKDYFGRPELYSLVTIATYLPTVLLLPFIHRMVLRFGKKRLCASGLLLSAAANTAALFLRTSNPYVFMAFCLLSGLGGTFLNMELWALITDVLDYQELLSHKREEGTCYAVFFFFRKMGQTMAGSGSSFLLDKIGYTVTDAPAKQPPAVIGRMYTSATLIPAAAYLLMFLSIAFAYPLDQAGEAGVREKLRLQRAAQTQAYELERE
jgi:GPH family glycoside/pentoside/hexuronide:cation symporter